MEILSKEYQDSSREIHNLEDILDSVAAQAKVVSKTLDKIITTDETSLLLIKIGKILDKHAADMAKI